MYEEFFSIANKIGTAIFGKVKLSSSIKICMLEVDPRIANFPFECLQKF